MKVLVTGGGGFLGSAIVRRLIQRGDQVRSFSRGDYPELRQLGVELHQGDIAEAAAVERVVAGCELVFHVAARPGLAGRYRDYYRVNVIGTENVLAGCRRHGVRRLVYTSSPSVVFDGRDMEGVNEAVPYPRHYHAPYPRTKALAEQLVLSANGPDLATVALRPHLIWGPEDNHLVPRLLERARSGRLRRIGCVNRLIDSVYIDNAAAAHLLAADCLDTRSPVAGKVYFITNGEPLPLWDLVNGILAAANLPPVQRSIPLGMALAAGWVMEWLWALLPLPGEPPLTRFLARELTTAHWFDISAARRDLGYQPQISIAEGLQRLKQWLREPTRHGKPGG